MSWDYSNPGSLTAVSAPADHPIVNSYWAAPQILLAGPHPSLGDRASQRVCVRGLLDAGIRTVVDLTTPAERFGVRVLFEKLAPDHTECAWFGHPILNGEAPSRAGMRLVLDLIDASHARQRAVYVHCMGGLGRTGTVVACWWIRHGLLDAKQALAALRTRRQTQPNASAQSPETSPQYQMIRSWAPDE